MKVLNSYATEMNQSDNQMETENGNLEEDSKLGKAVVYKPLSSGLTGYQLKKSVDGYEMQMQDGSKLVFDTEGRLRETCQRNGQTIHVSHTDNEIVITEPISGHYIKGIYDDKHRIVRLEDNACNQVLCEYDSQGNMKAVTSKTGTTNYYTYDINHRILVGKDTNNKVFMSNTYDEKGRVLTQDDGDASTALVRINYYDNDEKQTTTITVTDREGNVSQYVNKYSGYNLSVTDKIGGITYREYDDNNRLIKYTLPNGEITTYAYDEVGNIIKKSVSSGIETEYVYDDANNLIRQWSNDGIDVNYSYDQNHLMTSMQSQNGLKATYTYNENGQVLTESIEGHGKQQYTYKKGLLESVTDYNGNTITVNYDEIGNMIGQKDGKGVVTEYELDANGRVLEEKVHMADGSIATTKYTYDPYGNKSSETDALGNKTSYLYDERDNMVKETRADGSSIVYAYNLEGQIVKVTYPSNVTVESNYDAAGNLTTIINTLKGKTTQQYNDSSQLLNTTLPNGGQVSYSYYDNGLLHTQTDANGNMTEYTYDVAGRICMITQGKLKNTY